jgi:hypothetical protein
LKFYLLKFSFCLAGFCAALSAHAQSESSPQESDDTIIIRGERKERSDADIPGRGLIFVPKDSSQQDLFNLLAAESSVNFVETGRVSGSGFTIPKLRGQGSRSTDVWIDDFLVQDPLTGLPIIDEIDIRAFGIVKLYRGISPLSLHSAHHRGSIQFSPDLNLKKIERQIGVTSGRPYGSSGFFLLKMPQKLSLPAIRLFARDHVTDGEFSYYDDFATPYNTSDDRYSIRQNNHRRARMLSPFMQWRHEKSVTKISGIFAHSKNGIPSRNSHLQTLAEEDYRQSSLFLNHTEMFTDKTPFVPTQARVDGSWQEGNNSFQNQTTDQFGFSGDREIKRKTSGGKITGHWEFLQSAGEIALSEFQTKLHLSNSNETPSEAARTTTSGYAGVDVDLPLYLRFLQKAQISRVNDETEDGWAREQAFLQSNHLARQATSRLSALSWSKEHLSIYVQHGQAKKLPSLIETFGDGGTTRANLNILPETEIHREVGLAYHWSIDDFMSYSFFDDRTKNKIVFLPSIGETSRAENIGRTLITGHELNVGCKLSIINFGASLTRLDAIDQAGNGSKVIPGVAERQSSSYLGIGLWGAEVKVQERSRSAFYRDRDNSIAIPASKMHDIFIDGRKKIGSFELIGGISVLNVFNIRKADIAAKVSPDGEGATAQGDLGGYPVPGRQFKVTIETVY